MDNKKNGIPKLRFPGFTGAWEQRKLSSMTQYKNGKGHEDKQTDSGDFELVNLNSISIDGGFKHSGKFINESDDGILYKNDLVMILSDVGHGDLLGRVALIPDDNKFILNQRVALLRPNKTANPEFLFFYINSHQKYFKSQGAGMSQLNISKKSVETFSSLVPNIDEQKKISLFLMKLDSLIALHQRKLEHLQEQKKGLLQKMFPKNGEIVPEVRFPGFTDAWEQRKWADSINISNEMVDPTTGKFDDMPHIAPGNIESFTGRILDNVKTVKEEELISGKFLFKPGDVVFGKINPQLGKYFYARVEGLTSADSYVLNGKNKNITQKFIFLLLQTRDFFKYSVSVSKRSGIPKINREELNGYKFLIPYKEEQEKIGDFFLNIDSLITLHQRKLDHLELMKKGLLQQMFV